MFARWGSFIYRHRRLVLIGTVAIGLASFTLAARASGQLSSGGWVDRSSDSGAVTDRLATDFGAGRTSLIALVRGPAGTDATSTEFQAALHNALAGLAGDPRVAAVLGFAETGDRRFISERGDAAYGLVQLRITEDESVEQLGDLRTRIAPPAGYTVALTGYGPLTKDSEAQSEADLQRAETVSLPLVLLILIAVFASIVAAGLPLLVAGLAIPSTLAMVFLVAQRTEMSIYVVNIATMLGLALAIDYSLFMVSRFREELKRGRSVEEAVTRSVATSGKAVAFSGFAVAIGLSGLLLFEAPALTSIGIGGALVVLSSVVYALTFLPALLGVLGPRVNALSFGTVYRAARARVGRPIVDTAARPAGHTWDRLARWVMAHPGRVIVPTLVLLLVAGSPFLRLEQGVPDASILPRGLESRDTYVALRQEFPAGETTPIVLLATVTGDPTAPSNARALAEYAKRLTGVDGIARVESPFSHLTDPATGRELTPDQVGQLYSLPATRRPPLLQALIGAYIRGSTVRLDAISPLDASSPGATRMIPSVRAVSAGPGTSVLVGGVAAAGADFLSSMQARLPWAVGLTLIASAVVLFLLFGSVVLSVKAVLMTMLSISASFGALVWIFQEGHFADVLHFTPLGYTVAGNPVIMFSVLFGLSMDYEVLLLSRVQEAYRRTGDNTASVAEGLARTAGVITGAASIMVVVFAAFALADVITIKSLGVGMAIAVFLDATIIRVLLVPATMRLMGRWNWWAPGPLGRFAERLGFGHAVDEDGADPAANEDAPRRAAPAGT